MTTDPISETHETVLHPLNYETPQPLTGTTWDAFTGVVIGILLSGMFGLIYGLIVGLSVPTVPVVPSIVGAILFFAIVAFATVWLSLRKHEKPVLTGFLSGTVLIGFFFTVFWLLVLIVG
jgi:hypothetical protein